MTMVTIEHIRQCEMCSDGTREFFKMHGFDWGDFLKNGIDAEKLAATGDAMALQVVEAARGREQ